MACPTKEYQAFTSLVDQLLTVPQDEIVRPAETEEAALAADPRKRSPKPKVKKRGALLK
jgi:hypothetical protein